MLLRLLKYLWAGPNTVVALCVTLGLAIVSVATKPIRARVRMQVVDGVLEVHGGEITGVLKRMPTSGSLRRPAGAAALTLGHVVFAVDQATLDRTREHERVHVRQYERWGPMFLPAYLFASLIAKRRGQHAYFDNRFEREAYAVSHPDRFAVRETA